MLIKYCSKRKRAPIGIMYSPLAWVSGQVFPIVHILTGTARLICSKFTPEKTLRYLNKYPVSDIMKKLCLYKF